MVAHGRHGDEAEGGGEEQQRVTQIRQMRVLDDAKLQQCQDDGQQQTQRGIEDVLQEGGGDVGEEELSRIDLSGLLNY